LNRPEPLNAWGGDLVAGFYSCIDRAEDDPAVRVIVLTGRGTAFCAAAHLGSMATIGESMREAGQHDVTELVGERHPHFVTTLRKTVIAAINGACAGIGLTQALMCDVRFAAAGAKFATSFARRGTDGRVRDLVDTAALGGVGRRDGPAAFRAYLLCRRSGRSRRSLRGRLARDPDDHVLDYAEDMVANCSPTSLAVIKRQTYGDATRGIVGSSARAEALMHESLLRPDVVEGVTSFFDKRPPRFPALAPGHVGAISSGFGKEDHAQA